MAGPYSGSHGRTERNCEVCEDAVNTPAFSNCIVFKHFYPAPCAEATFIFERGTKKLCIKHTVWPFYVWEIENIRGRAVCKQQALPGFLHICFVFRSPFFNEIINIKIGGEWWLYHRIVVFLDYTKFIQYGISYT